MLPPWQPWFPYGTAEIVMGEVKWKNYIHLVALYSPILGAGTGFNLKYCDATHLSNR